MTVRLASGPLVVSSKNPRYFEDSSSGKIVYLTGTHTWNNFQDRGSPVKIFDYNAYLNFLQEKNMNFIRLWTWENPRWGPWSSDDNYWTEPMPYMRTGPGIALDGLPKFNLDLWNEEYFNRLVSRVEQAWQRGIYVSIMLFCGCSIGNRDWPETDSKTGKPPKNPWDSHPFNYANNINGVNGDPDGEGQGWRTRDVTLKDVLERQKAYVRKVIDTVNRYDNVLYEIANEDPFDTREWQYEIIRYIKEYEAQKPKRHPVGMTASWKQPNEALFESPADWISPYYDEDRAIDPLTATGDKVWIADSDHVFPHVGVTMDFAWKAFLRGANVISMDNMKTGKAWNYFQNKAGGNVLRFEREKTESLPESNFWATLGDLSQKYIKQYADRMNLAEARPCNDMSSTKYCLANPGTEYLIFQPEIGQFTVDLSDACHELTVEWFNPVTGEMTPGGSVKGGNKEQVFSPEFSPAVLYLYTQKIEE